MISSGVASGAENVEVEAEGKNFAEAGLPMVGQEVLCESGRFGAAARVFGQRRPGHTVRRERRLACVRPVMLEVLGADGADHPVAGELQTVSGRGIGLVVQQRLEVGQRFSLTLRTGAGRCALFYQVKRAETAKAGGYQVGAVSLGVLGKDGTDRPEHVILALMSGECEGAPK